MSNVTRRRRNGGEPTARDGGELDLIRTILGEQVPTDVLLQCLTTANFDVATAINLYFASLVVDVDVKKSIRSGMPVTLHQQGHPGMIGKVDTYATFTSGAQIYDTITATNEKYKVVRLRKRAGSASEYFRNGDIVSIECHGLWLKGSKVSKTLHWRSPSMTNRCKFVIQGLPQLEWLTVDTPFYLRSVQWPDRVVSIRSIGLNYNSQLHRSFLGLDRRKTPYSDPITVQFHAAFTKSAMETIPKPGDPVAAEVSESSQSITEVISVTDSKLDQMVAILGHDAPRDELAQYLDGAGGNIEIALEHYFMAKSSAEHASRPDTRNRDNKLLIPMPVANSITEANALFGLGPVAETEFDLFGTTEEDNESDDSLLETKLPPNGETDYNALSESSKSPSKSIPATFSGLTIEDFEMMSVLGRGSFGAVMMVRYKPDSRIFAIKILKKSNMDQADISNAKEERQILQRLDHPYVSSLVFAFQSSERLYLGMQYYPAGDLFYHLNERGRLPLRDARLYAAELVLAISYLHSLNILYRDLKPSNIMIDRSGHIGIVDFGLSKQHISSSNHGVKTLSGTAEYVAPEALVQYADGTRNYGKSYDWWSLGIVLYEMIVGESPFYDENEREMLRKIVHEPVSFPDPFDPDAQSIIERFLVRDPSSRLGAKENGVEEIKAHPFFQDIDWFKLEHRQIEAHWKPRLTSETDTRYVDPEFTEEGPPSVGIGAPDSRSRPKNNRFSQFSFDFRNSND